MLHDVIESYYSDIFCPLGHQVHEWSCKGHGRHSEEHESGKGKCAIYVNSVKNK